jgi:NAD kinase
VAAEFRPIIHARFAKKDIFPIAPHAVRAYRQILVPIVAKIVHRSPKSLKILSTFVIVDDAFDRRESSLITKLGRYVAMEAYHDRFVMPMPSSSLMNVSFYLFTVCI